MWKILHYGLFVENQNQLSLMNQHFWVFFLDVASLDTDKNNCSFAHARTLPRLDCLALLHKWCEFIILIFFEKQCLLNILICQKDYLNFSVPWSKICFWQTCVLLKLHPKESRSFHWLKYCVASPCVSSARTSTLLPCFSSAPRCKVEVKPWI